MKLTELFRKKLKNIPGFKDNEDLKNKYNK